MSLPNPNFVPLFPLQEQLWDKDLNVPLSAGYILFFQDAARTIPKDVFVQTQAPGPIYSYTDIGSQVTLSSIGTTQYLGTDSIIFLNPYDAFGLPQLYFIQVFSSTNVFQFDRSGWPPLGVSSGSLASGFVQSNNIISNPQFAEVLFDPAAGLTSNVTGTVTTAVAPDWNIITTGTGTVTINQIAITDDLAPGEPAYALDITSASVDSLILSQRITNSPRILENNFASGTFISEAIAPTSSTFITMNYVPSVGSIVPITTGIATSGSFSIAAATTNAVIPQTNTNPPGDTGYVDIQIVIQPGTHIQISCIQLVSVLNALTVASYVQESVPRQIDHLFHYYKPQLEYKPIPSYLVGWDFAFNPSQFFANGVTGVGATGANKSAYVWDNTIIFQTVNNVVSTARNTASKSLNVTVSSNSSFAIIQYLELIPAREILIQRNAIQIQANVLVGTLKGTVSLWWTADATLPDIKTPNFNSLVSSITAGVPTCNNGTWVKVNNSNATNSIPSFTLIGPTQQFNFNGFFDTANGINNAKYMAIVIAFDTMLTTQTMTIDYCSLVGGDIATRPAPQTLDEVARESQFYYRKSFLQNTTPATNVGINTAESLGLQSVAAGSTSSGPFIRFNDPMLTTPIVTLYNPAAANNLIRNETTSVDYSTSTVVGATSLGFYCQGTSDGGSALGNLIGVHWTADARLGTF